MAGNGKQKRATARRKARQQQAYAYYRKQAGLVGRKLLPTFDQLTEVEKRRIAIAWNARRS